MSLDQMIPSSLSSAATNRRLRHRHSSCQWYTITTTTTTTTTISKDVFVLWMALVVCNHFCYSHERFKYGHHGAVSASFLAAVHCLSEQKSTQGNKHGDFFRTMHKDGLLAFASSSSSSSSSPTVASSFSPSSLTKKNDKKLLVSQKEDSRVSSDGAELGYDGNDRRKKLYATAKQKSNMISKSTSRTTTTTTTTAKAIAARGGIVTARSVAISTLIKTHLMKQSTRQSNNNFISINNEDKVNSTTKSKSVVTPLSSSLSIAKLQNDSLYNRHSYYDLLIDQRDRSFARLLVATAERRMGQIDLILSRCTKIYPPKRGRHALRLQSCLRVGVAQLLFLQVPPHAAIRETVETLRFGPKPIVPESLIKFTNGVLRSISRINRNNTLTSLSSSSSSNEDVNIAPWLIDELKRSWGNKTTQIICQSLMLEPNIDISTIYTFINYSQQHLRVFSEEGILRATAVPSSIDDIRNGTKSENLFDTVRNHSATLSPNLERLRSEFGTNAKILPHGTVRLGSKKVGAIAKLPRYHNGIWWVQDASAALPAIALVNALLLRTSQDGETTALSHPSLFPRDLSTMRVVDMCAAPGGKTAQLLSAGFGLVTAVEKSALRSRRLVDNLKRLYFDDDRWSIVVADGRSWIPAASKKVDGILLDVPCSATATGRRRPDVLRNSPHLLPELMEVQKSLLEHCASRVLSVGGVLVYATCSLLKQESEDQILQFLNNHTTISGDSPSMEILPFTKGEIPGFDGAIDANGFVRVLPGLMEGDLKSCDGFFVARLRKIAQ